MERLQFSDWSSLSKIRFNFIRKKFSLECQNIITFDTETSNGFRRPNGMIIGFSHHLYNLKPEFYRESEPVSLMYIWQVAIETQYGPMAFYGRTWDEFEEFIYQLSLEIKYNMLFGQASFNDPNRDYVMKQVPDLYRVNKCKINACIFVHNLGFDFQGLRNIYNEEFSGKSRNKSNVFARSARKPIYASVFVNKIHYKFRDTLSLTQKSLKKWTEDEKLPVQKLSEPKGFYLPVRTPETPLTDEEMQYSLQDVVSMIYGIQKYRDKYDTLGNIPNTQTGEVRRTCVEKIALANPAWAATCAAVTKSYSKEMFLNLCKAFVGGWTHANATLQGELLHNMRCFDFASSYPAVMCTRTFPLYQFEKCDIGEFDELQALNLKDLNLQCHYLIKFSAKNIWCKMNNTFWSSSKCEKIDGGMYDNGKIFYAEYAEIIMTDLDFDVFRKVYNYTDFEVLELYKSKSGLLPREMVLTILDYYGKKTSLKGGDNESLYNESKQWINSIYGVSVTKLITDIINFDNGWDITKADSIDDTAFDEIIEKTSDDKTFLSYQIGVWVTAWARHNLWDGILALDSRVAYGDTDSLKGIFTDEDLKWFEEYNKGIEELEMQVAAIQGFDPELFCPKTKAGKKKRLGVWAREDDCIDFKTLGAKRYVYTIVNKYGKTELHATIAGLPKSAAQAKLKSVEEFETGITFNTMESGKTVAYYNDNQTPGTWIDRYGNRYYSDEKYGCCLAPTTFDLSISDEYDAFLDLLTTGQLETFDDEVATPKFLQ